MDNVRKNKAVIGVLAFAVFVSAGLIVFGSADSNNVAVDFDGGSYSVADSDAYGGTAIEFSGSTSSGGAPSSYADSLAQIQASTFRNKNEDNSPYINTPSVDLYDKPDLYGTARDYLVERGSYNGEEYFMGGYFPGNGAGAFRAACEVSHFGYDDPIVFPGQPEVAHLHMFIGNTHTNAYSTYGTMINSGGSTCNGAELNRTGYWVPAMFDGKGSVVVPSRILFYYKTENPAGIGKVQTYPENLQLLGDKTNNTSHIDVATFRCNSIRNGGKKNPSSTIPDTCPQVINSTDPNNPVQAGAVEQLIYFDYCWNGKEDTIGDWKANRDTNFRPPNSNWFSSQCPSSHPVLLPALVTHIFYDIAPNEDTSDWFIASDVNPETRKLDQKGGETAHADWFGAWNKEVNQEWVDKCSNTQGAECSSGTLGDSGGDPDSNVRALKQHTDFVSGYASPNARIPVKDIYAQMCSVGGDLDPAQGSAAGAYCRPVNHTSHQ